MPLDQAVRLDRAECAQIMARVKSGDCLMTDGISDLSQALGVGSTGQAVTTRSYLWRQHRDVVVAFPQPLRFDGFKAAKHARTLAADAATGRPVAVCGRLGLGGYFYSGIALAPPAGSGYEHFPFLLEAVRDAFHIQPVLARKDLSVYLDLAPHRGESPRRLVARLHRWGINRVHCSTWYDAPGDRRFMRELIAAAHDRGMVVYAWLEWPMVSKSFWDRQPECRERTASGADAKVDWRYHIALEDARCFDLAAAELKSLILDLDWDGIDIAELYFESPKGLEDPATFTPMHSSFREDFQRAHGIDPQDLFQPGSPAFWKDRPALAEALLGYRIALITQLSTQLLELCEQLKTVKPHLRTVMTVIDTLTDAPMKERIGVDPDQFILLQNHYGFDLEIEDPYTLWNLGPNRYRVIGERYRSRIMKDRTLSIDINIVDRQDEVYPTKKQRGLELLQLIKTASASCDRVILYGSSTLEPSDMYFAKYAMVPDIVAEVAGDDSVRVKAPRQFFWNTFARDIQYYVDGHRWPCVTNDAILVPAGEHTIYGCRTAHKGHAEPLRLENTNGEILGATWDPPNLIVDYASADRLYVTLNRAATPVTLDGKDFHGAPRKVGNKFLVVLPQGRHQVVLQQVAPKRSRGPSPSQ